MAKDRGDYIRTFSGKKFYHSDPQTRDICIEDIAHSLSLLCRFAGHVKMFYSVAEHCIRVSNLVPDDHALWGLMHDAGEAYCVDIPRPLKHSVGMETYRHIEHNVMSAIAKKFKMKPLEEPLSVKVADGVLLATEQRDLMKDAIHHRNITPLPDKIVPMTSDESEKMFLERFKELTK